MRRDCIAEMSLGTTYQRNYGNSTYGEAYFLNTFRGGIRGHSTITGWYAESEGGARLPVPTSPTGDDRTTRDRSVSPSPVQSFDR